MGSPVTQVFLQEVTESNVQVLRNLHTFYRYDLMPFIHDLPDYHLNRFGTIGIETHTTHQEENAACDIWCKKPGILTAFLIEYQAKLGGFATVARPPYTFKKVDYKLNDLFIANMYLRSGIGTAAVRMLFERFVGTWEVSWIRQNAVAGKFWHKAVRDYAGGPYEEVMVSDPTGLGELPLLAFSTAIPAAKSR